ncbi:MAG: SdpI family protein [Deltaproteobacteria bacterium]|nr:SdpI family protein [Deltaproteobacteria bacterium]
MNKHLVVLGALLLDVVTAVILWPQLPESVPVHWDLSGAPNRYGSRWELVLVAPGVTLLLWALVSFLSRIDPKVRAQQSAVATPGDEAGSDGMGGGAGTVVLLIVIGFLSLIHVSAMLLASGVPLTGHTLMGLSLAALQLALGNYFPRVRPNYFIGVRTPWTLANDAVWRRTHRLAGRSFVLSGIVLALSTTLLPSPVGYALMIGSVLAAAGVPAIYSYLDWKRETSGQ